jgi:WD40 repeat protein
VNHLARPPLHIELELARAVEADDPHGVEAGAWNRYLLRNPDGSGCYRDSQFLWNESVRAALAATSDAAAAGEAAARLAAAMRRFFDTAGWASIAARIRSARVAGRPVCLTVRSRAHEIHTLPWELLALDGTALCETDDCLLRYEHPAPAGDPAVQAPPGPGARVLVAWSARSGGVPAAEHIDAVAAAARAGNVRFDRARDVLEHASLARIDAALGERPATILHLLCHGRALAGGRAHGLVLDGADEPVPPDALAALLGRHRDGLRLVVLSACLGGNAGAADNVLGSVAQAVLAAGVPAVVAARYPLSTDGSVLLARILYQRLLVDLWSLERAFLAARSALRDQTPGTPNLDAQALQLHVRATPSLDFRPWIIQPYRGLGVYEREDGRLFFGRDEERAQLLARMAGALARGAPRLLLVAGASGTGKSSLVRAGLLGDLAQGRLSGDGAPWATAVMRPGEGHAPLDRLTRCVAQHRAGPAGARLALVVDQLEELFTEIPDEAQRQAFLRALWGLAGEPGGDVFVLATIRIDYLGHLGTVRMDDAGATFDRALLDEERYYLVRQLGPAQYERIIRGPAEAAGALIEPGLLDRLLHDLRTEPGALPLLSYTLDQLWQRRGFARQEIDWSYVTGRQGAGPGEKTLVSGWWLTDAAYDAMDGIGGALACSANALYQRLDPAHQAELRRVLVRLIHDHDDPVLATRRRGWRAALRPGNGSAAIYDQVVETLVAARLLVQGSAGGAGDPVWIELAHDALIRSWPALRAWYQEARAWLAQADELRRMIERGQAHAGDDAVGGAGTAPQLSLRGRLLSYHLEAWERYHAQLGAEEQRVGRAFLDASVRAERAEIEAGRARERAARRRTRVAAILAVIVAVVMSVLGLWARGQQREADAQRANADAQRQVAEQQRARAEASLVAARDALLMTGARELIARGRPWVATRLLESASPSTDVHAWRVLALEALSQAWLVSTLRGHEDAIRRVAVSPDGQRVATASQDGTARVWRLDGTGAPVVLRHEGPVIAVAFGPDGQRVVTASQDGTARVWRADGTGAPVVLRHEGELQAMDLSPDGTRVVTASGDGTVRIWRADGGAPVASLPVPDDSVWSAVFSPDGARVITGSARGIVRIWRLDDLDHPTIVQGLDGMVIWLDVSPDGTLVAAGGSSGTSMLWHIDNPGNVLFLRGHRGAVVAGQFRADGLRIITASLDRTVRMWSLEGPEQTVMVDEHPHHFASFAGFSPDGWRYVTSFRDGTLHLWDARFEEPVRVDLVGHESSVVSAAFTPDGKRLVTASADGTARVWHADVPDSFLTTLDVESSIRSATFSADGRRVLVTTWKRTAQVWHAAGAGRIARLGEEDRQIDAAAFSPDGARVATIANEGTLTVWRVDDGSPIATTRAHGYALASVRFSPDGTLLVTTSADPTARVWRADDLAPVATSPAHDATVSAAAFSPDGAVVVTASEDGVARLWRLDDPAGGAILRAHRDSIEAAAFSADGTLLLTSSRRDTCVWRVEGPAQATLLRQYPGSHIPAVFSRDGRQVLTARKELAYVRSVDDPARVITLRGHRDEIHTIGFSPDGAMVVTAAVDGETRVWSLAAPDQPALLPARPWLHGVAEFSPDGTRVLTTRRGGTVRIAAIDFEGLKASLRRASTDCLTVEMRRRYMGEAEAEARRGHEDCERGYGRAPRQPGTSGPGAPP